MPDKRGLISAPGGSKRKEMGNMVVGKKTGNRI